MNEIDKIFKSQLGNRSEAYSEDTWDKIEARLASQGRRRGRSGLAWMSMIAALIVAAALYTVVAYNSCDNNVISFNVNGEDLGKKSLVSGDINMESVFNSIHQENQHAQKIEADLITEPKDIKASVLKSNQINSISNNSIAKLKAKTVNNFGGNKYLSLSDDGKDFDNSSYMNSYTTRTNTTYPRPVADNTSIEDRGENKIGNTNKLDISTLQAREFIDINDIRTIGISRYSLVQSQHQQEEIELGINLLAAYRQDCPSFVTDRTGVYLDFYISHEMPFSNLSSRNQMLNDYRDLRDGTEDGVYSYSAGVRLTLMLPNGLGLKTGLNYSQVNEKFNYIDPESSQTRTVITIDTIAGVATIDTNVIVIPGTREIASINKYRSLDIPLLLSYEWDVADRTYMTVNGGILLNLLFKESGKILNPSGQVIELASNGGDQSSIFKSNIGLSLYGSFGLHYRWSNSFDLILEPNFRLLVKSATVDDHPISHKWLTAGLITGVRYNF